MEKYVIAEQWTALLPGRRIDEQKPYNPHDGVFFFEKVLEPFYKNNKGDKQLLIDFDGLAGFTPVSFLDDSFGTFLRIYKEEVTLKTFCIKAIADEKMPAHFDTIGLKNMKINGN